MTQTRLNNIANELILSRFGFLRKLHVLSSRELLATASNLVEVYKDDLDTCFGNELVQFVHFLEAFKDEKSQDVSREHFMHQMILKKQVQGSFPNVDISL